MQMECIATATADAGREDAHHQRGVIQDGAGGGTRRRDRHAPRLQAGDVPGKWLQRQLDNRQADSGDGPDLTAHHQCMNCNAIQRNAGVRGEGGVGHGGPDGRHPRRLGR